MGKNRIFYDDLLKEKPNPSYGDLLYTCDWDIKRWEIFRRDGKKCQNCGATQSLTVHHKKYDKGKLPWEYPNEDLITLCEICHARAHNRIPNPFAIAKTFFTDPVAAKKYNYSKRKLF